MLKVGYVFAENQVSQAIHLFAGRTLDSEQPKNHHREKVIVRCSTKRLKPQVAFGREVQLGIALDEESRKQA